ncbi:MAG: hypothetical protein MZV70_45615 [Desulfobacterales bacterium]|nr:hypothetical protein [Desulfobacterales bacterium]
MVNRYPHEFSGGQRQRIGIARALIAAAEADHLRRAGLGARRVDPGADHQPADAICNGRSAWRCSSSRTTSAVVRHISHRVDGALSRQDRGDAPIATMLYAQPPPSLYPGADLGRADPRSAAGAAARKAFVDGRSAVAGQPAVRLPLPEPAVRLRHRAVLRKNRR